MAKSKFFLGALIGAAAGAVAGVLTAPRSGQATRAEIERKGQKALKQGKAAAKTAKTGVKKTTKSTIAAAKGKRK